MAHSNLGNPLVRAAVRAALAGGTVAATFNAAKAQEAPAAAPAAIEEVVVTGSRIAVPNATSISPVTFINSEAIQQTGVTRVEDLLNQMPQIFADQSSNISNGTDGTATVNLRGLSPKRTLVLVNGNRLSPGDPGATGNSTGAADINMIPVQLIDSIEVLTGGASSVYGADAVAGVVNFKLNDHFEGVKLVGDISGYQHSNNDVAGVEEAISASGFQQAPSSVWTGAQKSLALIAGLNSANGNGNATFYATYLNVAPVLQKNYSYSACTLGSGFLAGPSSTGGKFICAGSDTSSPAHLVNLSTGVVDVVGPGGTLVPKTPSSLFNFGPYNFYQRPDERYNAGAFLHYDFNEHATVYANSMFMDDYTLEQVAPGGDFGTSGSFDCANPFLSPSELAFFGCTSTAGMTNPNVLILKRDVEGGPRQQQFEHTDFREVIGIKGKIDNVWSYDANFQYNLVSLSSERLNFFSTTKLNNAFDVVGTAASPACVVGPPCVPYNIFTPGQVTPAMLQYLYTPALFVGRVTMTDVLVNFTGDLGKYGLQLPTATSGLEVNAGAEYRDVKSSEVPDEEAQTGDLSGAGGAIPAVAGGLIAREGFIEARLPLAEDKPGAQALDLETGYRYSDYNLGFRTNTYKIGLDWQPLQDIRLRGSFARAVRAPNIIELFEPAAVALDGTYSADPCAGPTPQYSLAQCERTGVTPAEYGHIVANPAAQYNGLQGGNPALKPETALTTSFGVGFTPSFLPDFRAQIDYYDIKIEGVIENIGGGVILSECLLNDQNCNLINRGPGGTLWALTSGYVIDTLENVGGLEEKGVDIDLGYRYTLGNYGKIVTGLTGTYMEHYTVTPQGGNPASSYDCAGLYGPICSGSSAVGVPAPRWRHRFTATWETPWQNLDITLAWRYFGPVRLELLSPNPNLAAAAGATIANGGISNTDAYLASYSYFDLSAAIKLVDHVTLRLGCNNILDKDPPVIGSTDLPGTTGNGNTFPGFYDSLGRYLFAEITAQF